MHGHGEDSSEAWSAVMDREQLIGRYFRLQQELAAAYGVVPWQSGRIDRLANELVATEREIAALQPAEEQCSDLLVSVLG
jgi:hypothetical protein